MATWYRWGLGLFYFKIHCFVFLSRALEDNDEEEADNCKSILTMGKVLTTTGINYGGRANTLCVRMPAKVKLRQ